MEVNEVVMVALDHGVATDVAVKFSSDLVSVLFVLLLMRDLLFSLV
jgi:hypothetical protein